MVRSCRLTDTIKLYIPFPIAWNTEPKIIQNPAIMKHKEMIRSAGTPISTICEDAPKSVTNRNSGIVWNMIVPTIIILTEITVLSLIV